jgi:hypothetical protein
LLRVDERTIQAGKGSIWLFEQEQALGFSSVSTNTRMTVIKLRSGGLWVHAPIAPTKECIQVCTLPARLVNSSPDSEFTMVCR